MNNRFIMNVPEALKRAVKNAAQYRKCSQAEVVRAALYGHLKSFIEKDEAVP